jgi:hypothetical protein
MEFRNGGKEVSVFSVNVIIVIRGGMEYLYLAL